MEVNLLMRQGKSLGKKASLECFLIYTLYSIELQCMSSGSVFQSLMELQKCLLVAYFLTSVLVHLCHVFVFVFLIIQPLPVMCI